MRRPQFLGRRLVVWNLAQVQVGNAHQRLAGKAPLWVALQVLLIGSHRIGKLRTLPFAVFVQLH